MTDVTLTPNIDPASGKYKGSARKRIKLTIPQNIGGAPNILFFDRVDAQSAWTFNRTTPEIGNDWDLPSPLYKYMQHGGRYWIPLRDPDNVSSSSANRFSCAFNVGQTLQRFFVAYRMTASPSLVFPHASGANQPLDMVNALPYKPFWITDSNNTGTPDQVLPNFNGSGWNVFGNTIIPKSYNPDVYSISWPSNAGTYFDTSGASTLWGYYQSGDETSTGAHDAVFSYLRVDSLTSKIDTYIGDTYAKNGETPTQRFYDGLFVVNGQLTTPKSGWVNVQSGMNDFYVAEGTNCLATVFASNSATFATQTLAYIIPPESWNASTVSEVVINPVNRERLDYYHLRMANGTIINNVSWSEI